MNVFVRVLNGPEAGSTIPLRAGQVARFGRTAWADFGFPSDPSLGDVHFELRCGRPGQVVLRNLDASGTFLDGVAISESTLRSGQKIAAGRTVFSVYFETTNGGSDSTMARLGGSAGEATANAETGTIATICQRFEFEEPPPEVPEDATPNDFVATLVADGHLRDALRCQAFRLPKRSAVWWAWRCISGNPEQAKADGAAMALEAAQAWLRAPSDETARAAGKAAEDLKYGTAASWVAAAAFWSGENIAPPVTDAVAPPEHLAGTAVSAAVLLGALAGDPQRTVAWQHKFLEFADAIIRGDDDPPSIET